MGYTMAGFQITGGCEIDSQMADLYEQNLGHRIFREPIQEFRKRNPLPDEVLDLDILDGSPPCSSFSLMGQRDKNWGKKRYFREGQAEQVLDGLFFEFIALAEVARPRIVIGENVQGLVVGKARGYAKEILAAFDKAGYDCQLFLLDAAVMGVPQRRRRVFFIGRRKDLKLPPASLEFHQAPIPSFRAIAGCHTSDARPLAGTALAIWHENPRHGAGMYSATGISRGMTTETLGYYRSHMIVEPNKPCKTIIASVKIAHWQKPRYLSDHEIARLSTFPEDYDFGKANVNYVCGMSVPPRMMETLALELMRQYHEERTQTNAA